MIMIMIMVVLSMVVSFMLAMAQIDMKVVFADIQMEVTVQI